MIKNTYNGLGLEGRNGFATSKNLYVEYGTILYFSYISAYHNG